MKNYHIVMDLTSHGYSTCLEGVVKDITYRIVNRLDILASEFYDEDDEFREHILDLGDVPLGQQEIITDYQNPGNVLTITAFDSGNRSTWPKGWDGRSFELTLKDGEAGR